MYIPHNGLGTKIDARYLETLYMYGISEKHITAYYHRVLINSIVDFVKFRRTEKGTCVGLVYMGALDGCTVY